MYPLLTLDLLVFKEVFLAYAFIKLVVFTRVITLLNPVVVLTFLSLLMIFLSAKDEVKQLIQDFFSMVNTQFNKRINILRSDNGLQSSFLRSYYATNGILHQTSCIDTPQQNSRVERKHQHILNVSKALRFQVNLPIEFLGVNVSPMQHI